MGGRENVELKVKVEGGDGEDVASLLAWLTEDPEIGSAATVSLVESDFVGAMGWDLELINVVVANSLAVVNLIVASVALWRSNREKPPVVIIASEAGSALLGKDGAQDTDKAALRLLGEPPADPRPGDGSARS